MMKLRREIGYCQRQGSEHQLKLLKEAFSPSSQQCHNYVRFFIIDEFAPSASEACWSFMAEVGSA